MPEPTTRPPAATPTQPGGEDAAAAAAPDTTGDVKAPPPNGSILEQLREQREAIGGDRTLTLPVNGYNGKLLMRYKAMPYRDLKRAQKKASKRPGDEDENEVNFCAGVLANAAECALVMVNEDDDEPAPLHEQVESFADHPVVYDPRLAQALGIDDPGNATALVRLVFRNSYAVAAHFKAYDDWLASNEGGDGPSTSFSDG